MALEDALGATDPQPDQDPGQGLRDFIGQRAPDLAQNGVVDPQTVVNRLIRKQQDKLAQRTQERQKAENLDFAEFGADKEHANQGPDFAEFGMPSGGVREPPRPNDQPEGAQAAPGPEQAPGGGVGSSILGKVGKAARALTGVFGGETASPPATPAAPTETKAAPDSEGGIVHGLNKMDEFVRGGVRTGIKAAAQAPIEMAGRALQGLAAADTRITADEPAPKPEESSLWKAGEAVEQFGKKIPLTKEEQASFAGQVGSGLGTAGAVIGAGMIPGVPAVAAIVGGAALFGLSGVGETYKAAKEAGADENTARDAASKSGALQAVLGSIPLAAVLRGFAPKAATLAVKMLLDGTIDAATFTSVGELQTAIQAKIDKLYNKNAPDYELDPKRIAAEALTGGVLGAGHAALNHGPAEAGAGAGTGAGAGATVHPEEERPTGPGFETTYSRSMRDNLERRARYYAEHSANDIHAWSDTDLFKYVRDKDAQASNSNYGRSETHADDDEILRRFFPDAVIASWSPEEKAAILKEAKDSGVMAGAEEPTLGSRDRPIDLKDAAAVKRAGDLVNENYSHAQGEANNIQRVHVVWNGMDATLEVGAGGVRKGIAPDGAPFEQHFPLAQGYFKGTTGADKEKLDVNFGQHPTAPTVYVIDELDRDTGKFKQHKVFAGVRTPIEAIEAYKATDGKNPSQIGGMRAFSIDEFREWRKGDLSRPVSDATYYNVSPKAEPAGGAEEGGVPKPPKIQANAKYVGKNSKGEQVFERPDGNRVVKRADGIVAIETPLTGDPRRGLAPAGEHVRGQEFEIEPPETHATAQHRAAIEKMLRENDIPTNSLRPRSIAHAAEIHAHEGLDPALAFQVAIARDGVADGLLTSDQVKEEFGEEVAAALSPPGTSKPRPEARRAGTGGATAPPAAERVSGGEEARPAEGGEIAKPGRAEADAGKPGRAEAGEGAVRGAAGGQRAPESAPREPRQRAEAPPRKSQTSPKASSAPLIGEPVEKIGDHAVTAADGVRVKVKPVVVEAADLITSYDKGYDAALQPRNRGRAASQAQIREIVTKFDPERFGYSAEADRGSPIVGPDKMVESGNGRIKAFRIVYRLKDQTKATKYRDWLKSQGVDVDKYKQPVLVRQRVSDLDEAERRDFAVAANQGSTLSMSAPERAMADAGHITPDMLDQIRDSDLGSLENRGFIRSFVGTLPASERGNLTSATGGLSAEGLFRVRNAVLAKAYGDIDILSRITESTDDDVKSISNALVTTAPAWAKMRAEIDAGRVPEELDITTDLLEAVKRTADVRSKGMKIDDYLAQEDAFDTYKNDIDYLVRLFYDPRTRRALGSAKIAEALEFYAREAAKVSTEEEGLGLGISKVTSNELKAAAAAKTQGASARAHGQEGGGVNRPTGAGANGPRTGGERMGRRLAEPEPKYGAEPGAEGRPQLIIPGAEQRSGAELARRRAGEPLKPRVAQKAAGGLFGDESAQLDLVDQARKTSVALAKTKTPLEVYAHADKAWSDLLKKEFGKEAGDVRYTARGKGEPGTELRAAHDAREAARQAWEAAKAAQRPQNAFPDQVAPPAPPPQIPEKPKAAQTSLFGWETPNERPRTGKSGAKALAGAPAGEGQGTQGGGQVRGGGARGGRPGAAGNRAPDAIPTLFDFGGEGGGATAVHPPATGERRPGGGRAGGGAAGTRPRVPTAPAISDVKPEQAPSVPAVNYRITNETELGKGSEGVKFRDNLAAIQTLKAIELENRRPTPAEQRILARYVGWGGLSNAFRHPVTKEFKPDWKERGEQVESLLTKEELSAARHSTPNAHYTSKAIVDAAWKIAERLGFKGGLALESSMGTGNFLGLIPEKIAGQTRFVGVELDSLTARIAKALYPQETVIHSGFQKVPLPDGEFTLSIGNPPFGNESLRFSKPDLYGHSIHNQFFLASLDALRPGGLHIAVVSHSMLDAATSAARQKMAVKADLLGAIRLPDTAFKENARTEVVTDLVVMQRRTPEDEKRIQNLIRASEAPGKSRADAVLRQRAKDELRDAAPWVETDEVADPLGGSPIKVNQYFVDHPDMIVGRLERSGTMHPGRGEEELNVKLEKPEEFQALLDKAVERMPRDRLDLGKEAIARTLARYKSLTDSIHIALRGLEPGHLEYDDKGNLTQIHERETANGDFEPIHRVVTPETPWSQQLALDHEGKWFTLEPTVDSKGAKVKQGNRLVYERKYFPGNKVPPSMQLGAERYARLSDLTRLRDLLRRQIELETQDAPEKAMERNRGQLAASYRAYTEKNGLLHEPRTMPMLNEMPDGPLLMSLENSYRPAVTNTKAARTGQKVRKASAKPALILSARAVHKYEPPTKAASPADAVLISLSEAGRIDMERMQQLLGMTQEEVDKALTSGDKPIAFYDPELQRWEARDAYLSGHVRRKLAAARLAGLDKNIKELEAIQPEDWTADQVTPLVGSNWIPPKVYEDFAKHLLGTESAAVQYSELTNSFNMLTPEYGTDKQAMWGTPDMPADAIIRGMLNSRLPKVKRPTYDEMGRAVGEHEDKEAGALVALKAREIEQAFADWVYTDGDRRRELVKSYNDKFNTRSLRQFDGTHLTMPGKSPDLSLRRHVLNAIWRGIQSRNLLLDHVVGAGKTFSAIGMAIERRRMGLSQKPMVTVPNHLVEQWASEAYRLYPGAKILAAGKNQFDKKNRRKLFARITTGDWDMVIVPHSSFGFIGISPGTETRYLEEELRVAQQAVQDAWADAGNDGGRFKPYTVKEAERLVSKIEARLDELRGSRRDNLLTFEQMGVDHLIVDEAHEFKNLFYHSRMQGVRGMGDKGGVRKALDLYDKIRVLNESPTGAVTFLTGTPISNSAAEMFTMLRYLAAKELKELGMEHFDAWRSQFVTAEPKWEPTESGGMKEVTRLGRRWANMRALMDLYRTVTDSVTQEDINRWYKEDNNGEEFPIPKLKGGERQAHAVKPTKAQKRILKDVIDGFDHLDDIQDPDERNAERLRLMDRARKVSLDARAVDPAIRTDEKGGKLEAAADEIARIYKKWNKDKGTQMVFSDRGVPKSRGDAAIIKRYDELVAKRDAAKAAGDEEGVRRAVDDLAKYDPNEIRELRLAQAGGWNAYDQLKKNLIKRGVPADEIRFMQEANTDGEKKEIIDAMNAGEIRVLLGSTQRMGAGTNAQERIVAGHHLDVTWKPSDIEQRQGRWVRQGNKLFDKYGKDFEVEEHAYVTENTVDAKMWDLNSEKLRMINGIRKYDGAFDMDFGDEDAVSMQEIAALASGDPLMMERVKLTGEIEKLEMQERGFRRKVTGIEDAIDRARREIAELPGMIEATRRRSDDMKERLGELTTTAAMRRVSVNGQRYSQAFDALKSAEDSIAKQKGDNENGKYKVEIDGNEFTNKEGINSAITAALGDSDPFEAKIDGETYRRRWTAAKTILDKIKEGGDGAHKIGRMLGTDLDVAVHSDEHTLAFALGLTVDGKTIASSQNVKIKRDLLMDDLAMTRDVQSAIHGLERDALSVSRDRPDWYEARLNAAQAALPKLLPQLEGGQQSPYAPKLQELRDKLREVIGALDAQTQAKEAGHKRSADDYVAQALENLMATSRTANAVIDTSSTPDKAGKIENKPADELAAKAKENVEEAIRDLYAEPGVPDIDEVAKQINAGIVKRGQLDRTADTKFPGQTRAEDLLIAKEQFITELAARLADRAADPVETAAWIEWRTNLMDHFWSDGAGKTSRALAAVPLMRADLPLPKSPPNAEFVRYASTTRVDPRDGGDAYLGQEWRRFNAFYHHLIPHGDDLRPSLERLISAGAPAAQLAAHPMVRMAVADNRSHVPTGTREDFENPAWQAARVYDFDGEKVQGMDNAVARLIERAQAFSTEGPVENDRHAIIIIGPPAAGKSTVANPLAARYRAAIVDADEAKKVIPEYDGGVGTTAVHEESSYMSGLMLTPLAADGANLILPKVGHGPDSIRRITQKLSALGYTVDLVHAAATPELSGRRNIQRFLKTGRLVDPTYIAEVGEKPHETYHLLKGEGHYANTADIDTATPNELRIIEASGTLADALGRGRDVGEGDRGRPGQGPEAEAQEGAGRGLAEPASLYTSTPEFKRWFGASKAVDEAARPLVAYHGSVHDFDVFDTRRESRSGRPSRAWSGDLGSWFAAPSKFKTNYDEGNAEFQAASYTEDRSGNFKEGANVKPVYLSIKNPKEYQDWEEFFDDRHEGGRRLTAQDFRARLTAEGHDGIVIRNSETDGNVDRDDWVAFRPEQIKSATGNSGAFDPNTGNMLGEPGNQYLPPPSAVRAYDLGAREKSARKAWDRDTSPTGNFHTDWAYGHLKDLPEGLLDEASKFTPVENGFYESGKLGLPQPVYTTGARFGEAPEAGHSYNYREQTPEHGVSMAQVNHPDFADYNWPEIGGGRKQPIKHYEGWLLPFKGSDDEPLMVGLKARYGNMLGERPSAGLTVAEDRGHFYLSPARPSGQQAQDYILRQGMTTGLEHLLGIDEKGRAAIHLRGQQKNVAFDDDMLRSFADPNNRIVIHHNHPSNGALSEADISMLGHPGIEAIWSHGHGGNITRGALTDFGRSLLGPDAKHNAAALGRLASTVGQRQILPLLTDLIERNLVPIAVANRMHHVLIGEVLRQAGILHYHTTNDYRAEIKDLGLQPYLKQAADTLRRSIPNAASNPRPGDDRSTGNVFRHLGDVGATFERRAPAPAARPQPRVVDRASRGNGRAQAPPEQLGLRFEQREPGYYFDATKSPLYQSRTAADVGAISEEAARKALDTDATARRILAKGIAVDDGEMVGVRLNINVLKKTGVAVQSVHRGNKGEGYQHNRGFWGGEVLTYKPVVSLREAYFNVHQPSREKIASGESPKMPMASVDGRYASDHSFDGVEFRFNPKREHLFVDKLGRVLRYADHVTITGNSVFARGHIEYYGPKDVPERAGSAPTRGHLIEPDAQPEQSSLFEDSGSFGSSFEAPRTQYGPQPPRPTGATQQPPSAPRRPLSAAIDRIPIARQVGHFWKSTFQPELVSDKAFGADPLVARYKSVQGKERDTVVHESEKDWEYWNKKDEASRIRFIDDIETATFGNAPTNLQEAMMARRYRRMLDANWALEKRYGSQAAFVEDYFPHVWEKPDDWRKFSQARSAQVGPTWFQKKRTIDYITDGLAAGMKLKYTNPVDIITHRLLSGADMRARMDLLYKLKEQGLAWEGDQGGPYLVKLGWQLINAPDRKQWLIAPDAQALWKNGVEAKGLWQAEHVGGGIFRGWMAFKNAWVPIKLALSAFHPLHVLHIDQANSLARSLKALRHGDLPTALRAASESLATLPTLGAIHYRRGAAGMQAWLKPEAMQTPEEKAMIAAMQDGGFSPQLSEELRIKAQRQLAEAFAKAARGEAGVSDWRRMVSGMLRRPIEVLQKPIFEKWIPALKTSAYLDGYADIMKRHPEYLNDDRSRRIAARALGKSIDNRYGEMHYGTLFWDRTLKDASIASFLSLGWNLGFVREFGGAAMEAGTRPAGLFKPFKPTAERKITRDATNKIAFALAYITSAAIINGLMTLGFTGQMPHGVDFIFARIGGETPEGWPRRVANMFYLREVPMLLKHIQEHGGNVLSGLGAMVWNKLMFEPFVELWNNRNYYGYNIWDENAPIYKQIWQALLHTYGDQFNPMSVSGAKHAANLSGAPLPTLKETISDPMAALKATGKAATAKGVGMSMLGFGPAPAYVEKSAIQNRIGYLYEHHVAPVSKPEEAGENTEEKMAARQAYLIAKRDKDWTGIQEARQKLIKLGMKPTAISNIGKTPTDIYLFSRLPNADQKSILNQATPEERQRYWPKAHGDVKQELHDLVR